jgi:hypothetical protein
MTEAQTKIREAIAFASDEGMGFQDINAEVLFALKQRIDTYERRLIKDACYLQRNQERLVRMKKERNELLT